MQAGGSFMPRGQHIMCVQTARRALAEPWGRGGCWHCWRPRPGRRVLDSSLGGWLGSGFPFVTPTDLAGSRSEAADTSLALPLWSQQSSAAGFGPSLRWWRLQCWSLCSGFYGEDEPFSLSVCSFYFRHRSLWLNSVQKVVFFVVT